MDDGIVYTIAPSRERVSGGGPFEEWTWQAHQPAAGTLRPIADAAGHSRFGVNLSHVFGRFRIAAIEGVDVAILVRHVDSPVYAWRLN
jgi:coproporphyrinogen III oxidase